MAKLTFAANLACMHTTLNIALIGYGKMGHAIETIALQKGHRIGLTIDMDSAHLLDAAHLSTCDVAIEFTGPHAAVQNISACLRAGIPVVSGSTGWLQHWEQVANLCTQLQGGLLYASNFSIGVNLFFELNKKLASLMAGHSYYRAGIEEVHHTAKKDAPSGTAITLAEQIMEQMPGLQQWVNEPSNQPQQLSILSKRIDPAPGTHHVKYSSVIDDIEIIHTAHNRQGFASGAVLAAEFLAGKKGIYSMKEVLGL